MLLITALNECSDVPQWNLTHGGRPLLRVGVVAGEGGVDLHQLEQLVGVGVTGRPGAVVSNTRLRLNDPPSPPAKRIVGVGLAGDVVGLPAVALARTRTWPG